MTADPSKPSMQNRREWIRSGLRWSGLLAVGGLASLLGWRGGRNRCGQPAGPCGACPLLDGCQQPQARASQATRRAQPAAIHGSTSARVPDV